MMHFAALRRAGYALAAVLAVVAGAVGGASASQAGPPAAEAGSAAPDQRLLDAVRAAAVPLRTVEPGGDAGDLAPLGQWIGDARIVSLGEATHGTAEFFRLKHRVFQYLVEEMGFTAFAFEAMLPESLDINHYIHTGEGDPRDALTGQYFWVWDTAEVLDLIEWMRGYNADPRHRRKISFYGYDMQRPTRAAKVAVAALERVAPDAAAAARLALADVLDPFLAAESRNWPAERKAAVARAAERVLAEFRRHDAEGRAAMGEDDWDVAHRHAVVLDQFARFAERQDLGDMQRMFQAISVRDQGMADNIDWILQREGPGSRVALWAHNYHVGAGREPVNTMGQILRDRHGQDMFVFAFAFNGGGFQARELPLPSAGDLKPFVAPPAARDSFEGVLHAAGLKLAALDVRPGGDETLDAWLDGVLRTREFGSGIAPAGLAAGNYRQVRFPQTYDAVLFVDAVTAAQPNSPWVPVLPRAGVPINGGFEEGCGEAAAPPGWNVERKSREFGFQVGAVRGGARGECVLSIRRVERHRFGEAVGGATQRLEAAPYRGRTVTLDTLAWARLEADGVAHLWIQASRDQQLGEQYLASREISLRSGDAAADAWQRHGLMLAVPEDADTLTYGLALVGGGEVRLDKVSVKVEASRDAGD